MARFLKNRAKASGAVPGSPIFIGKQKMEAHEVHIMHYDEQHLLEQELDNIDEALSFIKPDTVTWINIYGIHDIAIISTLGRLFNLPSLLLESIANTDQRPKYEDGDDFDAFILKMLHKPENEQELIAEQVTMVLKNNLIITIQERKGDVFKPVRERIRKSRGRIRTKQSDYLLFALFDTMVDNYSIIIEDIGQDVEDMENRIFTSNDTGIAEEIYRNKLEINFLRKVIRPTKEVVQHLIKSENSLFDANNTKYLAALNDLVGQAAEAVELYNTLVADQLNIYNTNVSNRMNETMKVLTVFASIFIPLTFLAGIYGMNFTYMPELGFKYSYPLFWVVVLIILSALFILFKRKKWF